MSEHNANPLSILNATLPSLLPACHRVSVDIQLQVIPKANVMLVPADKMRATADGSVEVLVGDPPEWRKPPDGVIVHELGKPLPVAACDVAAVLGTLVEDTLGPKLLQPGQQQPRGRVSSGPLAVIARAPLDKWQAAHVGALRGPVE